MSLATSAHASKALTLLERMHGRTHPSLCLLLKNLAGVLIPQGRAREGIPHLKRAIEIGQALGDDHPTVKEIRFLLQQVKGLQ